MESYSDEDIKFDQMIRDMCSCYIYMVRNGKETVFGRFETEDDAHYTLRRLMEMNLSTVFFTKPTHTAKDLEKEYGDMYTDYIKEENNTKEKE